MIDSFDEEALLPEFSKAERSQQRELFFEEEPLDAMLVAAIEDTEPELLMEEIPSEAARDSLDYYLRGPRKRLLTREEEKQLFLRYRWARKKNNSYRRRVRLQIRNEIAERNLGLVVSIARWYLHKYFKNELDLRDMIQDGNMGLLRAIDKFDVRRGYRFSTMATWWIRKAIANGIVESPMIRLPHNFVEQIRNLFVIMRELESERQRQITIPEIESASGIKAAKIEDLLAISKLRQWLSFETPLHYSENHRKVTRLLHVLPAAEGEPPSALVEYRFQLEAIRKSNKPFDLALVSVLEERIATFEKPDRG